LIFDRAMSTKRFFLCLALALGVVFIFNLFLAVKVDSVPKLIMRQMRATPRIDILFLGNSLMQSGFEGSSFAAAWPNREAVPTAFNAGLGSSSPVEHYLLADQTYRHYQPIRYLVYGFYDLQLTEPPSFAWKDLVGNRSMAYSVEPAKAASLYADGSTLQAWRFRLIGAVPMLRDHSQLWKYVEIFRRSLQEIGLPKAETNQFGRVADFQSVALPEQLAFEQRCASAVQESSPLIPAIKELLRLARDQNTQALFVEMPMTSVHRNLYYSTVEWQQYRRHLQQQLQAEGVAFSVASDWITNDADFSDGLHLDKTGADIFSKRMAQVIAGNLKPN
jgi:hypothetical protein